MLFFLLQVYKMVALDTVSGIAMQMLFTKHQFLHLLWVNAPGLDTDPNRELFSILFAFLYHILFHQDQRRDHNNAV